MYRYILEPYKGPSSRYKCPECNKPLEFARYIDTETGEQLPDHVGRCNREGACGYHYTPKQHFEKVGGEFIPTGKKKEAEIITIIPIDFISKDFLDRSMKDVFDTNFGTWLKSLFGAEVAISALENYKVGRSTVDNGKASIFWRIDKEQRVRTGKIVCYDPNTGKRKKSEADPKPFYVHTMKKRVKDENGELKEVPVLPAGNYQQCFFGEHLLSQHPQKNVGIVESEKTAIIASIFMPQMVWIATGGASGCKWKEYSVFKALQDKTVVMFPDFGYFNRKAKKTCYEEWLERSAAIEERMNCKIKVSRVLEDKLTEDQRLNDFDLVDMLVKQKDGKGWALTDDGDGLPGYPVMWDLKTA